MMYFLPESGSLIRGVSVDDSNSTTNVIFSNMSDNKMIGQKNHLTANSSKRKNEESNSNLRSVNSPVPFPPPSISLPDTPSLQNQNDHFEGNNRLMDTQQIQTDFRMNPSPLNPFTYNSQNSYNGVQHPYLSHGANAQPMMMHSNTIHHPSHRTDSWQMLSPRRSNSIEKLSISNENIRYHHQVGC